MKNLSVMLKPASSLCNLRCKYCFYADVSSHREQCSYGMMSRETVDRIVENLFCELGSGDHVNIAFQGGEPTLAGLDFFHYFVGRVQKQQGKTAVTYALQTNGIVLDEQWAAFLKEQQFLVGLSLDGASAQHDFCRVDAAGKGTFRQVLSAYKLLERFGVPCNVLSVLTDSAARHPQQFWNFIRQQNLRYVQLIPCLGDMEGKDNPYALTPKRFASFYIQLFDLWEQEFSKGNYYSIKLFDDLINLLVDGSQNACGLCGACSPQIVVEADGSVYPCDFYVLDKYKMGDLVQESVCKLMESKVAEQFRGRPHTAPTLCQSCPYRNICGGGCKRMQRQVVCSPGDRECGYKQFLDACLPRMSSIAQRERQLRMRHRR